MVNSIKKESLSLDSWFDSEPWRKWKRIGLTRLAGSSKAYLLSHWKEKVKGPLLVIVPHLRRCRDPPRRSPVFYERLRSPFLPLPPMGNPSL